MSRLDCFPLSYNGNKYQETKKHLATRFPTYKTYDIICEPFCGIFGFSRAFFESNIDFKGEFWLNDINMDLINLYKELLLDPLKWITNVETELAKYTEDRALSDDKNKSYSMTLLSRGMNIRQCSYQKAVRKIIRFKEKIELYKPMFAKIKLFNLDCIKFLELIKNKKKEDKKIFTYFDPPYFNSSTDQYQSMIKPDKDGYNDGTYIYIDIFNWFKDHKDNTMIINKIDILNYLFTKWIDINYGGIYQGTKNVKKHIVYSN